MTKKIIERAKKIIERAKKTIELATKTIERATRTIELAKKTIGQAKRITGGGTEIIARAIISEELLKMTRSIVDKPWKRHGIRRLLSPFPRRRTC